MKKTVTLTIDNNIIEQARSFGLNISQFAQRKLLEFITQNSNGGEHLQYRGENVNSQISPVSNTFIPSFIQYEKQYARWLKTKQLNKTYERDLTSYVKKHLTGPTNNTNELVELLSRQPTDALKVSIRSYINFLVESNIMGEEIANGYRKVLKNRHKVNPDNYVPDDKQVVEAYNKLVDEREKVVFKVLMYSGARQTEVIKLLSEYDPNRLIENEKIVKYPLNWRRGQKNISYLYLPKELAADLHRFYVSKRLVDTTGRKCGLRLKYLRKWQYNYLILNSVPESVCDFIQGRSPESVGSMHYLGKVKQADYWYESMIAKMSVTLGLPRGP